jgi:hypothetical protein
MNNLQLAIKNYERMDVLLGFGIWFNGKWGKRLLGFFPPCSDVLGGKRLSGYFPKIFGQFRREAAFRIFSQNFRTSPAGSGFPDMVIDVGSHNAHKINNPQECPSKSRTPKEHPFSHNFLLPIEDCSFFFLGDNCQQTKKATPIQKPIMVTTYL